MLRRVELKRAFSDGTVAIDMDPLSLVCRLAAAVPPPRFHVLRYAGVLAGAHKLRSLVVPPHAVDDDPGKSPKGDKNEQSEVMSGAHAHAGDKQRPATHRCQYRPWAELMKRTFAIDVETCERCGARMRLRALVTAAASIERYLRHLGEPTEPPPLSPAPRRGSRSASRGPPFFKSRVLRRKFGELDSSTGAGPQTEMSFS